MRYLPIAPLVLCVALAAGCNSSRERPEMKRERDRAALNMRNVEKARDDATEKASRLEMNLADVTAQQNQQRQVIEKATQENAELQRKLDAATSEAKAARAAQAEVQSKFSTDLDAAKAKADRAQAELAAANDASNTARETVRSQQQEIDRLKLQITAMQEQAPRKPVTTTTQENK